MRTFKEYYDLAMKHHLTWLYNQKEEWWKDKHSFDYLSPKGDYIETVNFLTIDEKNDSSLFHNHTNVKNSEWGILFSMLGQALVDWCRDNVDWENLWSFNFKIKRNIDGCSNIYDCSYSVNNYDFVNKTVVEVEEENVLERYKSCSEFLCDLVDWFITKHGKDIPNDWNYFSFGLDSLMDSCEWGEWVCASDGYMNLGNLNTINSEDNFEYDEYVECM